MCDLFEPPSPTMLRLFVEWADHALPVCTLFAGVTFALAFVDRATRGASRSGILWHFCAPPLDACLAAEFTKSV